VGSRVRIAAAACLVATGLLAGGASASIAFADPLLTSGDHVDKHTSGSTGSGSTEKQKNDPDDKKTTPEGGSKEDQPGTDPVDPKTEGDKKDDPQADDDKKDADDGTGKNGDNNNGDNGVGNPGNGNCGNSGGNGNAHGCGGGSDDPDDPTPPTTPPPTTEEPPPPPDEPGECEKKDDDHCSPSWPWWPWPWPWNPGEPPGPGGGGGGGSAPEVPSGRPGLPPQMQLPPELMPPATEPSVIDVAPGVGVAVAELAIPPITLPVIVAPAAGLGGGGAGTAAGPALPAAPRGVMAEPPAGREPPPANAGSNVFVPASSYRIGYTDYLRNAGLSQVAALAVPGVAGMLVLTFAGGFVGYRQAKAGHAVHTSGTARFVN
jgi:hypothetical protein